MTRPQEALYWREWAACKAVRKARCLAIGDDARHALHRQALGCDVSMKDLTNRQFDKVLGVFRSFSRPADLNSQLRTDDQPEVRKEISIEKCYEILSELAEYGKKFEGDNAYERYLNGTAWAIFKRPVRDLDDADAGKLYGILLRQLKREQDRLKKIDAETPTAVSEDKPF